MDRGLPLCVLLERAGLEEDACAIVLEPDRGVPKAVFIDEGRGRIDTLRQKGRDGDFGSLCRIV
jgi:hypothetical protein